VSIFGKKVGQLFLRTITQLESLAVRNFLAALQELVEKNAMRHYRKSRTEIACYRLIGPGRRTVAPSLTG